jgi:hypothetical protein
MEYQLLKTIEHSQSVIIPKETLPRLTPFPANNCINPGLGQIARLYSFYVPMYSRPNLHSVSKNIPNVEPIEQEGKGETETDIEPSSENDTVTESINSDNEGDLNPIEYNERKRKLMGSAVQDTFLHPKMIKTNTIVLSKTTVKNEKKTKLLKDASEKHVPKHKFQFI